MSAITDQRGNWYGQKRKDFSNPEMETSKSDRPWEKNSVSKEERRWYILGALKAALCIGFVYILGLGLLILFLIKCWT